jgi:hypothetical protein
MAVDEPGHLARACEAYLDEHNRLLSLLRHGGNPARVGLAMQAQLDQSETAVRLAQPDGARTLRHEPGS